MNVTYLLGAGASYNALPILSELPKRLQVFMNQLSNFQGQRIREGRKDVFAKMINDLGWLIGEVSNHQTVDTFARKLFLNSNYHKDLIRFKSLLTSYFFYEQTSKDISSIRDNKKAKWEDHGIIDKRYDSFIAALISDKIDKYELNPKVKILSWNYDSQLELAYRKFNGTELLIDDLQTHLQVMPTRSVPSNINMKNFATVKLNGSASFYQDDKHFYDWINGEHNKEEYLVKIAKVYEQLLDNIDILQIRYAWESLEDNIFYSPYAKSLTNNIKEISETTDILVVIGYSFPIFNRKVDKQIIDVMAMNNLDKIYIQDKHPDRLVSLMKNSFDLTPPIQGSISFKNILITAEDNVDSFLLPPELN